ncbi:hypothetical protein NM208_g12947 [Fusarium decemcellulare]|uniref:Uncharacterized protein n=1 Tax=Fusarium decemcellulare TaxID=57161 RepID=A0ACC1RNK1_9HYPO|nr:hypothetical protein NM208_g12947 [Fusarium decemcellulare]
MRETDIPLNSFIAYERNGEPCVRSQIVPEPSNDAVLKRTWVWVATIVDDKYTVKQIRACDLPEHDRDTREIPKAEDVFCAQNPFEDTIRIFPGAIRVSRVRDKLAYEEGQVLGADQAARDASTTITAFSLPGLPDQSLLSAMSRGFQAKYPRPPGVGAGWGDWDAFREWQLHGRHIQKTLVEPGNWKRGEYRFLVDGDSKTVGEEPVFDDRFEKEEDMKGADTLYAAIHKNSERGGHRGGQRGGRPMARNW